MLAVRLNRTAVIPVLIDNGLQRTGNNIFASANNQIPFSDMYDQPYFIQAMAAAGLRVMAPEEAPPITSYTTVSLVPYGWSATAPLAEQYSDKLHVAVDCPLLKMAASELTASDWEFMWAVLDALRPNPQAAAALDLALTRLVQRQRHSSREGRGEVRAEAATGSAEADAAASSSSSFNFLHLRIENDWVAHCQRWASIQDGMVRDNCFNYTEEIGSRLALFGLPNSTTLYVGSYWADVEESRRGKVFAQLAAAGYRVITSADLFPAGLGDSSGAGGDGALTRNERTQTETQSHGGEEARKEAGGLDPHRARGGREYKAMLDYFLAMRAERFIGNSVSTFTALEILERRRRGQWAAYYNGGNIPLASLMPGLHRLPWVFTYNSWSPDYEYMLRGAVRSALATRSFTPYCIFQGNDSSPIATWLQAQGVRLISHTPAWTEKLLEKARVRVKDNVHHSHLFKTPDMLVATFQRVDLPVVPVLDQYTYVLYTDADVYFRKPIRLDDFGLPLPHSVSMSYEFVDMFPYNAGVIVANLPTMRQNYAAFIDTMLANDNGLFYTNYGPADQGIMNKFYEADLRGRMLNQVFNAKPYNSFDPNAFIVHFHGPKPHDLLSFMTTGKCDFFSLCESAFLNGLCTYTKEWVQWVYDDLEALRLEDACAWLGTPALAQLLKQKWGIQEGQGTAGAPTAVSDAAAAVHVANRTEEVIQADGNDIEALSGKDTGNTAGSGARTGTGTSAPSASEAATSVSPNLAAGAATTSADSGGGSKTVQGQQQQPFPEDVQRLSQMRRALMQSVARQEKGEGAARREAVVGPPNHAQQLHQHRHQKAAGAEANDGPKDGGYKDGGQSLTDIDKFNGISADEAALEEAWQTLPARSAVH
ncbi:hypothetical protein VaNZ11_014563 [Volvox africanus]|uniref:O-fucosyltransferase family protein n=1 Tax=Volvox africanus TaxID=51714 RepID=A0ABQ5SL02_9CHLO|nr:hypothetical protein VaNZ11_014563 [Volvox africanus]